MRALLPYVMVLLALAGCDYSSGTNVTQDQAKQFTVGVSRITDVEAKLGNPSENTTGSDGKQTLAYQYDNTHQDAQNYVPIVGLFASHVEQTSSRTTFVFSPSGVLESYTTGNGNSALSQH